MIDVADHPVFAMRPRRRLRERFMLCPFELLQCGKLVRRFRSEDVALDIARRARVQAVRDHHEDLTSDHACRFAVRDRRTGEVFEASMQVKWKGRR